METANKNKVIFQPTKFSRLDAGGWQVEGTATTPTGITYEVKHFYTYGDWGAQETYAAIDGKDQGIVEYYAYIEQAAEIALGDYVSKIVQLERDISRELSQTAYTVDVEDVLD